MQCTVCACCTPLCYPKTCCCCVSPRTASIILAILGIIIYVIDIIESAAGISAMSSAIAGIGTAISASYSTGDGSSLDLSALDGIAKASRTWIIISAIFSALFIVINCLLLYGVFNKKPTFMIPWGIVEGIHFVLLTIALGIAILVLLGFGIWLMTLDLVAFGFLLWFFALLFLGAILLHWHFVASVRTHYYELKEQQKNQVESIEGGRPLGQPMYPMGQAVYPMGQAVYPAGQTGYPVGQFSGQYGQNEY